MLSRAESSPRKIRRIQKNKNEGDGDDAKDNKDKESKDKGSKDKGSKGSKDKRSKDKENKDNESKDKRSKDKENKDNESKDKRSKDKENKDNESKDKRSKDKENKDNESKDKRSKDKENKDNESKDKGSKDKENKDNESKDKGSKDKDNGDKDNDDNDNDEKDNGDKDNDDEDNNEEPTEDLVYGFYRLIIHPMILRLKSQRDKLNYSHWLNKLDECEDPDYKMPLIKMLFISLKNNRTFNLYAEPPVDDLSELNLDFGDTTMDMLRKAQETTNEYYIVDNENILQEVQHKRSAAVATDMCSYIASKTSRYLAQSFYVRSDFPIQTWYNPAGITVPKNIDHNQWELYLNRFDLLADEGLFVVTEPHTNTCESIMNLDQVPKELNPACIFRWHPHSILYSIDRPKRSAGFMDADQDISTQPISQQNIDESAFTIVHKKSFPGYKILNPRTYSTLIMPDPDFVFNMTGVRITYNNVSHLSGIGNEKAEVPIECQSNYESLPTKTCFVDGDETKSIWVKPKKPISTKTTQNKKSYQYPDISSNPTERQQINTVKSNNSLKSNQQKKTSNEFDNEPLTNSKCVNKNIGSECSSKSKKISDPNMSLKTPNSYSTNNRSKQFTNNQSKVQYIKQCNMASMNDTSNWTSIEMSSVQNSPPIYSNRCKVKSIEPNNSKVQCSGQSSRKRNNQNYEEPSHMTYDRTNQRDSKSKQYRINKQNNTGKYKESFSKSSTSAMNECSDSNEKISKPKYDENSDREISDYFEVGSGESIACTGKSRSIQQYNTKSLSNLPTNENMLSSDESYNSGLSTGTGINESFSRQTYSNSSDSLSTLTSDFSSNATYPDHDLDFPTRSTKHTNNGNQINRDYSSVDEFYDSLPSTDYTNEGIQCPFNNSKQGNSNSNRSQSEDYQNNSMQSCNKDYNIIDNDINDMSFPQTSYEESCSSTSLNNSSRDLENMSMPSISYETSCSENNASFDD